MWAAEAIYLDLLVDRRHVASFATTPASAMTITAVRICCSALGIALFAAAPLFAQAPERTDFTRAYNRIAAAKGQEADGRRLNRLMDLRWRQLMTESPETATYVGFPGQNGRWTDLSPAAIARRKQDAAEPLRVLRSIERSRLNTADRLNYDLLRRDLDLQLEGARFPEEYLPVGPLSGAQQDLARIVNLSPAARASFSRSVRAAVKSAGQSP